MDTEIKTKFETPRMVIQTVYNNLLGLGFIFTVTAPTIPLQVYHGYKIAASGDDKEAQEYYKQRSESIDRFTRKIYDKLEWKEDEHFDPETEDPK